MLKFILFADDTNLFYKNKCQDTLIDIVNAELKKLSLWFKINKMSLNIDKTNYIFFGRKKYKTDKPILIDNSVITKVIDTKFLGVMLDSAVSWKNQIQFIVSKISRGVGILYRLKSKLDNKSLQMIYSTLILPYFNYCCEIWGNTSRSKLDKLIVLQKKAIRVIGGLKRLDHTSSTFAKLKCLKLEDIIQLKTCLHVFNADNNLLPSDLQKRYCRIDQIHNYNTRNCKSLYHYPTQKKLKEFCISVRGVEMYNNLQDTIKTSKSTVNFRARFKKHTFSNYN